MKLHSLIITVMAALLIFSGDALAAKPDWAGSGGGPGSGDGGVDGGGGEPPDYGDLVVLYRDAWGVPYLTADGCQQPLPSEDCLATTYCALVDGVGQPPGETSVEVLPVDEETCAVLIECATCTQEVEFGRMNNARAPDSVFASQLDDVTVNLATADCLSLDPAGRLVTSRIETVDGIAEVTSGAIDSPLQNLAIYKELMLNGDTGVLDGLLPEGVGVLDTAARGLGAASDKTGKVNVDMVAYLNQIMGLTESATVPDTYLPKICIDVKEEVMGNVTFVEKCFLNYDAHGYTRTDNFSALPDPGYISPRAGGAGLIGWFEYLAPLDVSTPYYETFQVGRDRILHRVFGSAGPGFEGGNIGGFAQAADDTRAVIDYMHTWPLPAEYATPLMTTANCSASTDTFYDVSISPESGLQVPVQMVDGKIEGREFIVTVANAGPDPATGTVTVSAVADKGGDIFIVDVSPEGCDETLGECVYTRGESPPWVFEFEDLAPGFPASFPQLFSTSLGQQDKISWTATADAEFDVLLSNNQVTATTNVRGTGSGGGKGGGGGGEE